MRSPKNTAENNRKAIPTRKYSTIRRNAPPPPVPIYTQIFLDIFQVKAMVAAALSLIFSVMVVGRLTVAKKERTVVGGG